MGLDQYAGFRDPTLPEDTEFERTFYWRKHSRLQAFMEEKWNRKCAADALGIDENEVNSGPVLEFNCETLFLNEADIDDLEEAVTNGYKPTEGGFFWGHQFQEEAAQEYQEQDLEFCRQAREAIREGLKPYYYCWY